MNQAHSVVTKRQNRTKADIEMAFIRLIKDKGFQAISVKNIVEEADYNRSTFYLYYQDKYQLADVLLQSKMKGLEEAVAAPYVPGQIVYMENLDSTFLNIIKYIFENRDFFQLLNYQDTLPGINTELPAVFSKIYQEQFKFETINHQEVNMKYFKRYHSYGFYGLILQWVQDDFRTPQLEFVQEFIKLTKTLISSLEFVGESSE